MYPVCHCHAEPVATEAGQGWTEVRAGFWDDLQVALLIGEAEQLTRQAAED